jgi:hypothetical protein
LCLFFLDQGIHPFFIKRILYLCLCLCLETTPCDCRKGTTTPTYVRHSTMRMDGGLLRKASSSNYCMHCML